MNPTFRDIDFASCSPGVTRLDSLVAKIWVKIGSNENWRCLLELSLELPSLHFVGKSVSAVHMNLLKV